MLQLVVRITRYTYCCQKCGQSYLRNVKSISNALSVVAVTESCAFEKSLKIVAGV